MHAQVEFKEDVCIVRLNSQLTNGSHASLVRAQQELEAARCRTVILDCGQASYLDAACLGFIAVLYKSLRDVGGQFVLTSVTSLARQVLRTSRLDTVVPIFEDEHAALAELTESELVARSA